MKLRAIIPGQGALFGRQPVHLFRFDLSAVCVPPFGNPVGNKLRLGDWRCVMCAVSAGMAEVWDDCGTCPGQVRAAPAGMTLRGTADLAAEEAA